MNGGRASGTRESGAPLIAPRWLQVDAAAAYMGGVSRKTVYAAVAAGMRVARLGDGEPHRDCRGRLCQGRMLFCTAWIDAFLEARSVGSPLEERTGGVSNSLISKPPTGREDSRIATDLQQAPKSCAEAVR